VTLLSTIEYSAFCTWVRESNSLWAYPGILFMHTMGTAMVVGVSAMVDLRVIGFARRQLPMAPLERYFPVIWAGFWVSAISGTILFAADATSKIVSPLFGMKMLMIVLGVLTMVLIRRTVFRDPTGEASVSGRARWLAAASLVLWFGAIAAGRLMAYIAF
jgi:hypothetical protein